MNNQENKGSEDKPRDINPEEIGKSHPAKHEAAKEKTDIKESGAGRDMSQTPADEHIEPSFSENTAPENTYNEINDDDDRDHGDSTKDWDAENSRTGRHK
ncbi:hypothetical protein [Flavobacterium pallidum]|uniref:Uncharacterized protein n=1 Tax=Flavobacterium pallidum TaxID=2172098 RepID=A0A2S1SJD8_9FLAO|nr:hypothetical protein [Flavobacterium pallidum]AWI26534.1 hypothetical protein HYN49_11835 [Flavobacterium pallidum]